MKKSKASMQSVADELKISKVTVSKALNDKEGVSESLRERIKEIAKQQDYTISRIAANKVKKIGVIMNTRFASENGEGKMYLRMYENIVHELAERNYSSIMLTPSLSTVDTDIALITDDKLFDGIIILGLLENGVRERLKEISIPKIYVDMYDRTQQSDSVVTENFYSVYDLTKYVIDVGHNEIGFVGTIQATTSITDRYLGFKRALYERQLRIEEQWIIPDRTLEGESIELQLPKEMPSAFICNCDETAFRLVRVLTENGYAVPDDISVASFDNDIFAEICIPKLTTVAVNAKDIADNVAKLMKKNIERPSKKHETLRVKGQIIFRDSVKEMKAYEKE